MSTTEINLWLDSHRMDALEEAMEAEDTSVEKYMQNYLIELYTELVPLEEQQRVDRIIAAERQAEAEAAEAQRKFCVYMITENGQRTFLSGEQICSMRPTRSTAALKRMEICTASKNG